MVLNNSQFCLKFQVPLFMMNIYKSLTEDDGQSAGVLKNLLEEPDMDKLLNNPFKITAGDVKVIQSGNNFFIWGIAQKSGEWHQCSSCCTLQPATAFRTSL